MVSNLILGLQKKGKHGSPSCGPKGSQGISIKLSMMGIDNSYNKIITIECVINLSSMERKWK